MIKAVFPCLCVISYYGLANVSGEALVIWLVIGILAWALG
jgi:hypothetical protein